MHTYLQQAQTRVVIHRTQVAKKKWKLRARFSPTKEDRVHQTKISTKTDKGGFSPAVFRSRLEQKTPSTEYLVYCVCVLFSMPKFMLRMSSVFVSIAKTFHSFAISAAKVPSVSALEFRCCRVIPLRNQSELSTKESAASRGTMIFRREVIGQFHCKLLLSPESAKTEALVVEPV